MFVKVGVQIPDSSVFYIATSIWVLHTPYGSRNLLFGFFKFSKNFDAKITKNEANTSVFLHNSKTLANKFLGFILK